MQQVTRSRRESLVLEEGEEEEEEWGEGGGRKLHYYLKVMGLFEQVSCPLAVLDIAEKAVRQADDHDPLSVSPFWVYMCSGYYCNSPHAHTIFVVGFPP